MDATAKRREREREKGREGGKTEKEATTEKVNAATKRNVLGTTRERLAGSQCERDGAE